MAYNFQAGGASDAIMQVLAQRKEQEQRDLIQRLAQQQQGVVNTRADAQLKLQQDTEARIAEAQKAAQEDLALNRRGVRVGEIAENILPGVVDAKTAGELQEFGRGDLVQKAPVVQGAPTGELMEGQEDVPLYDVTGGGYTTKGGTKVQAAKQLATDKAEAAVFAQKNAADIAAQNRDAAEERARIMAGSRGDARDAAQDNRKIITFNQIAGAWERSPLARAGDRTIVLEDAVKNIEKDPANAPAQMALSYAYIQALDTYMSAVREGEVQSLGVLGTRLQNLAVEANRVVSSGAFLPPEVAKDVAENAKLLVDTIKRGKAAKQKEYKSRARVSGVGDMWDQFVSGYETDDAPAPGAAPAGAAPKARMFDPATGTIR